MKTQDFLKDIFIIDGLRTAIGARSKSLKSLTASQIGGVAVKEIVDRNKIPAGSIDEVIIGNTVSAGAGQNIAKQTAYNAGLPHSIPAFTINNVCGSGLQSVILAAQSIGCGQADIVVAGSTESATHCPTLNKNGKGEAVESLILDGLWCQMCDKHMGHLAEITAEKFGISRKDQDEFALKSHQKAMKAQEENKFEKEIVPVQTPDGETFSVDEKPRKKTSLEKLGMLPSAFVENGTVTAGNSCSPCDGAAAVIIASSEAVKKHNLKPKAKIIGYATAFAEPEMTFTTAIESIKKCLKNCDLSVNNIDLFEISEAFAVQAILTKNKLNIPDEKINIWGGDIALGHPLGAAGTRILVTLINALIDQKKKIGLAAVCFGSGGSIAMAIEIK